jgi:hypothetical protein
MILARAALALLAVFGTSFAQTTVDRFGDGGVPGFYKWTGDLQQAGTLLRSEPLPANLVLPEASRAERILYSSTEGLKDKDRIGQGRCSGQKAMCPPAAGQL